MAAASCSLSVEPLPQHASSSSSPAEAAHPLCGAFDPATGCLLLGSSSGSVSCVHLTGRYGSSARKVLGRHAGRVTAACLFPWQAPQHVTAAATLGCHSTRTASFFATCSADAAIKLWSSDPKALHSTDACLQTLRGHRAAVTSLAAVQVAHTWCLLSGSADGQLLLWRSAPAAEASDQQMSGAAMLSQLVPHMQLTEAPLYASPHWVLSIACPQQQTEAGACQGAFVVLSQQPLLQVPISRSAVSDTAAGVAASAAAVSGTAAAQRRAQAGLCGGAGAQFGSNSSPTSPTASCRLQRPGSAGSGSHVSSSSSSSWSWSTALLRAPPHAPSVCQVSGTQHLSMLAVAFVQQQMAVLTLAYDGACRLHSIVEGGGTRCCWRSPTGSSYTAVGLLGQQLVLLGDDRGSLHIYSLATEKLLATKQVASSRIAAIISCCCSAGSGGVSGSNGSSSSSGDHGSSSGGSSVSFAVLSADGLGLWQLRQGFSHGIVPGGHRQAVIALQLCHSSLQAGVSSSSSGSSSSGSLMLLSGGQDGRVIQWDATGATPAAVQSVLASAGAEGASELTAMTFLAGAGILATGHDNGQVLLWRMDTGSHTVLGPQAHTNTVSCMAPAVSASKGGGEGAAEQLVSGGFDGVVCLWEPRQVRGVKPHLIARFQAHGHASSLTPVQQHQQHASSSSSSRPASGSRAVSSSVQAHAVGGQQQQPASSPVKHSSLQLAAASCGVDAPEVLTLLFDPLNQVIITGGNDGRIKVWAGGASGMLLGQHVGHTGPITALALDGSLLFSGSHDTTIRVWDVLPPWFRCSSSSSSSTSKAAGQQFSSSRPPSPDMAGSSLSRAGTAAGCRVASSAAFAVLRGHSAAVTGLAVAADSGVLVSCSGADGVVLQWDYCSGQVLSRCSLQGQQPSCVAVEPDTRQVHVGTALGQLLTIAGTTSDCSWSTLQAPLVV